MPISSKGVILVSGATASPTIKLCDIKAFPDLGGAPSSIETTDLSSEAQTFINGIMQASMLEFTANYDETTFDAIVAKVSTDTYFAVSFGPVASNVGLFSFTGQLSVPVITGAGVDGVIEMKISIAPSSKITKS